MKQTKNTESTKSTVTTVIIKAWLLSIRRPLKFLADGGLQFKYSAVQVTYGELDVKPLESKRCQYRANENIEVSNTMIFRYSTTTLRFTSKTGAVTV